MISLDSLTIEARQAFEGLQGENGRLTQVIRTKDQIIELQEQKIRLLNFKLWGPKGETLSPAQTAMLFQEASVTSAEIQKEASQPPAQKENPLPRAKPARANHPGREKLPEHLERREVMIPCHPKDCLCGQCGQERPIIGYERSEELVCDPATFHVRVTCGKSAALIVRRNKAWPPRPPRPRSCPRANCPTSSSLRRWPKNTSCTRPSIGNAPRCRTTTASTSAGPP